MTTQDKNPETDARALLGELLKQARVEGGFPSQGDLSPLLRIDRSGVSRAESGGALVNFEVMGEWLAQCRVSGLTKAAIVGVWKLAKAWGEPGKARTAPWFEQEAAAHTLRFWAPTIFPGISQTRSYSAELYRALGHDKAKITELVNLRAARQAILSRGEGAPETTIVLWEPVLHHQIGTPETMREQLAHMLALPSAVVVQVVPGSLGANAGLGSSISLATADGMPELLVSDGLVDEQITNNPVPVRKASATFNRVRGNALNIQESRVRLTEAMEKWQSKIAAGASPAIASTTVERTA
jgi:hypothetical protein